jgi:flagellar protein FliO/FliZ
MDISEYFRFALALIFVLALIGVLAAVARRAGFGFPASSIKPSGARRLSIVEVTPLDGRRRLVLIRRDNVEHLLMLSPNSEHVIERGIAATPDFAVQLERAATRESMPAPEDGRS